MNALRVESWYSSSELFLIVGQHQNFVGGNNQFERYFRKKLKKYFIDIKNLPKFTKPSVTTTMHKKSAKVHLILLILLHILMD